MIKKLIGAVALMLTCTATFAAGGGFPLDKAPYRVNDMASLQNGAKLFVNYCLNCHSASSMRYNKLKDIGLTDQQIKESLLFTGDKIGDMMHVAMTPKDAKAWFGTTPPDLSVIARAKSVNAGPSGSDYLYTYLRTFYRDTSRATTAISSGFSVDDNAAAPGVLVSRSSAASCSSHARPYGRSNDSRPVPFRYVTSPAMLGGVMFRSSEATAFAAKGAEGNSRTRRTSSQ